MICIQININIYYILFKTRVIIEIVNAKLAIFVLDMKKPITGLGLPSYTSTAQRWPGNAEILKKIPHNKNATAIIKGS